MNAFAFFPGDRFVGNGAEGDFSMHLTDLDGNPVGEAFGEWPQLSQTFGDDRHQATVGGTTSAGPDPLPESVLIGFTWDGPEGQESEIRFEAEAMFDSQRLQMADQIEDGDPAQEPPGSQAGPIDEGEDSGSGGFSIPILVGIVSLGATAGLVLITRSRVS